LVDRLRHQRVVVGPARDLQLELTDDVAALGRAGALLGGRQPRTRGLPVLRLDRLVDRHHGIALGAVETADLALALLPLLLLLVLLLLLLLLAGLLAAAPLAAAQRLERILRACRHGAGDQGEAGNQRQHRTRTQELHLSRSPSRPPDAASKWTAPIAIARPPARARPATRRQGQRAARKPRE